MGKILKFLTFILLFFILVVLYARYGGTYGFITKEYTLYSETLPDGFDGMKIVHLSDIHYNRAIDSDKIKKIVNEINLINPDIVVFTGDLIDKDVSLSDKDYVTLGNILDEIDAKYGKYAVLGNHDYKGKDNVINVFDNSGFKYLENEYEIIYNQNNEQIFIGGIGNVSHNLDNIDSFVNDIETFKSINYKIMLVHEPDISDNIVNNFDSSLILAGHSHNGQIRIPGFGPVYTPEGSKKYYDEYYDLDGTPLYVSSGIGVSMINYRLFNKPSINFYRINKKMEH